VCGHSGDAEDAVQEALIRTYRSVGSIRDPEAFRSWLYRTVRNACLVSRRKRAGEPVRLQSLDEPHTGLDGPIERDARDPGKDPEQLADNATLRRQLRRALRALPGPYREVVFLRELEGLSTQEVAHVTGISEANVKTRLHRARTRLQSLIADR
jgi:RNA polymerase sigma-70 factor (ECF subfamily)